MATKKRNLRTGKSLWPNVRVAHKTLKRNIDTEVLIVGSGISGAMVADLLTEAGYDVVMVDRRKPVRGSTAASTSLILYEIDTPLMYLSKTIGKAKAERAWQRSYQSVQNIRNRLEALDIFCALESHKSLYLAGNLLNGAELKEETLKRRDAGFEVTYLARKTLEERYGLRRSGAIMSHGNLSGNPVQMTMGFLNSSIERGMKFYSPVEIKDVQSSKAIIKAHTNDGHIIRCKYVIFCTGYEFPDYVPMKGHRIVSTYVMATKLQPRKLWPEECLIWESSDPYLYLRTTKEGRIIVGGEDEEFADEEKRDALLPQKTKILQQKLHKLFPHVNTDIDYAWTGSFGTSKNGLPLIGEIPGMKNCWAVLGYGGNGITFSRIAAEIVSAGIQGKKDTDADLFKF